MRIDDHREVDEPTEVQDEIAPTTGEPQTMAELLAESEREDALRPLPSGEARRERRWLRLREMERSGEVVEALVMEANRGGVVVDVGLRGFVPLSQLSSVGAVDRPADEHQIPDALRSLVGRRLPVKVLEVDQKRDRLILSEKAAAQAIRRRRKAQAAAELSEGDVLDGTVTQVTGFGLFVDIGAAEGLVHRSEVTWDKARDPLGVYRPGDEVRVQVTGVDRERDRISLSIRRLEADPWERIGSEFTVGADLDATITRILPFGAFARIAEGLEGLIHVSELASERVADPAAVVQVDQRVRVRIVGIDPDRRRLSLSMRQAEK